MSDSSGSNSGQNGSGSGANGAGASGAVTPAGGSSGGSEAAVARGGQTQNSLASPTSQTIRIRLLDAFLKPIANAPYKLQLPGDLRQGVGDDSGWMQEVVVSDVPLQCQLDWGYPDDGTAKPGDDSAGTPCDITSVYHLQVFLQVDDPGADGSDDNTTLCRRLHNLGYSWEETLGANVTAFQRDHQRPEGLTGDPNDVHGVLSDWHDAGEPQAIPYERSFFLYGQLPDDQPGDIVNDQSGSTGNA